MINLEIVSPKRKSGRDGFSEFYPYYAGFPEAFVRTILKSADLSPNSIIFDPWNGSGTTTAAASRLGFPAIGFDLNPVMVVIAKARLLPSTEASSLRSLAKAILDHSRKLSTALQQGDPLLQWFSPSAASKLRRIERSCAHHFVETSIGWTIDQLSSTGATFYASLFAASRRLISKFKTSNPTWIRIPKAPSERIAVEAQQIEALYLDVVSDLADYLTEKQEHQFQRLACEIKRADATCERPREQVDCVITSPPYCTRIDYAAATRIELALLSSLAQINPTELRHKMIGTTTVPKERVVPTESWGDTCVRFLRNVESHTSRASKSYYYPTLTDYFDKMARSIDQLATGLRQGGTAILIVQDSYYKDLRNDVPQVMIEMSKQRGLELVQRKDFASPQCMSRINSRSLAYSGRIGSTESVLCLTKR